MRRWAALGVAIAAATSCDAGKRDEQPTLGPALNILGVNVGVNRPMPVDGAIQFAFDRYLLPATVNRQAFVLSDAARIPLSAAFAPIVTYDPIARTMTLSRPQAAWLVEGQTYKVVLNVAVGEQGGLRAIDGATLADQPREFTFIVGPASGIPLEPNVSFCRDVLPIMQQKCGGANACHVSGGGAASGLVLTSSVGFNATALNRIAQGSNTGPRASPPPSPGRYFGVDMPIIDPGNPGNSWLLYKVDLARDPELFAEPPLVCIVDEPAVKFVFAPLAPNAQRTADPGERAILADFVLGSEMPFPASVVNGYPDTPLTFEEREKLRLWIKNLAPGAAVPECRECAVVADAGTTDAADAADASDASDAAQP